MHRRTTVSSPLVWTCSFVVVVDVVEVQHMSAVGDWEFQDCPFAFVVLPSLQSVCVVVCLFVC